LVDWDDFIGNIDLVIQGVGTSTKLMNQLKPQQSFAGIAGPLGRPSVIERYDIDRRVVFITGEVGLPPVLPILKEHLELDNQTVLISGLRNLTQAFWHESGQRLDRLQSDFPNLEVIYSSEEKRFGLLGLVSHPLQKGQTSVYLYKRNQ
jgi:2-polyprenylphenol hydroxylase and related flavodoxin oxidoreductases